MAEYKKSWKIKLIQPTKLTYSIMPPPIGNILAAEYRHIYPEFLSITPRMFGGIRRNWLNTNINHRLGGDSDKQQLTTVDINT
jgi:hypothetical protein